MASITLKNITKVYPGGVEAVKDFSFVIEDREFIILVGPSGCGKSTTLRMIAGLEDITAGELYIGDELVNDVVPKERDIAMVFQNYALYPHMSVYKNMAFGLRMRKMGKEEIDTKVKEAAKILDIEHLLNRKPRALSGGQRQRVALGRAMVRNPAAFLLDEPLSNLDAKLRTSMRTEIIKLHKKIGTTFVYVTHDQTEAMTMGDRIVVMKDGFIQQVDTPQNLYDYPNNLFVAGFIGSPQMNFIETTIKKSKDNYFAAFGKYEIPLADSRISKESCEKYLNKKVMLGIRPEHIIQVSTNLKKETALDSEVELVELMGAEKYVYFDCQDNKFIARVPGKTVIKDGDKTHFVLIGENLHLFDLESEEVIK